MKKKMTKKKNIKKQSNKKLIITITVMVLLIFISYKYIMLNKYHCDNENIDTNMIFNETLTINKKEYHGEYMSIDDMQIANYFDGYSDTETESTYKIKRDSDNNVISFYSMGSHGQYIDFLSEESLDVDYDGTNGELIETSKSMRSYLNSHNIKNDIDLLKYIKENYFFKNNILTCTQTIKNNYLLNTFVERRLFYKNIILIDGDLNGYINNVQTGSDKEIKEIHILKDNKQYVILLGGDNISSNEFIINLLSTITFN